MVEIVVTDRDGAVKAVACQAGQSLMEGLRDRGFDIAAICGGMLSCATCHVYLQPDGYAEMDPPSDFEQELLSTLDAYREGSSRLSCQLKITVQAESLAVTLAPEE